jgi:2-amino-4-hydroxy-6-hydroxymethyldihydropteridine diphosphokinase
MPVLKLKGKGNRKVVYIGFGSNLGERRQNIRRALSYLRSNEKIEVVLVSPIYDNPSTGYEEQPRFLNGVAKITTSLSPVPLLKELKGIEKKMGREAGKKWASRIIDLDILFYDCIIFNEEGLVIPHQELHKRWFVLKPFNEIAPDFKHPVLKKTIHQLFEELDG